LEEALKAKRQRSRHPFYGGYRTKMLLLFIACHIAAGACFGASGLTLLRHYELPQSQQLTAVLTLAACGFGLMLVGHLGA
jgi:hypothetical protein